MSSTDIKIAVVDDHPIIFSGIEGFIKRQGIELIFCALNKRDFLEKMQRLVVWPDLVFIDIEFREGEPGGFEILQEIKRSYPDLKTVIYSVHSDNNNVQHALALGANGFLTKSTGAPELIESIRKIMDGRIAVSGGIKISKNNIPVSLNRHTNIKKELSPKEIEVMLHLCNDLSRKEIAGKMNLSIKTIDSHCHNIFSKAKVRSAHGLVAYAAKQGWLLMKGN